MYIVAFANISNGLWRKLCGRILYWFLMKFNLQALLSWVHRHLDIPQKLQYLLIILLQIFKKDNFSVPEIILDTFFLWCDSEIWTMFWENSIETSIRSSVKQITSPGWMHETSAQGWCTGKTQRDGMGREAGVGIGMGNTCKSMADSCQCMAKTTTIL